jgi:TPR repeat protein
MGQVNAETGFGVDLVYGKGAAPDLNRGLALIEKAAAKNHPAALYQLGTIYDNGDFARQNTAKAAELIAGAARARYWQAEYWMGVAYEVGRGVARNRPSALALLDRAAGDGQAGMPQMLAAYLRSGGASKHFANADELNAAFNADFHDQYNSHYFPSGGDFTVPGSREWWNRLTGNSTACYFNGRVCPKR